MERPYIICHMLQSIDGKIAGNLFDFATTLKLSSYYQKMSIDFHGDAIVYGSVTLVERYGNSKNLDLSNFSNYQTDCKDFVYRDEKKQWVIGIDPLGEIGWDASCLKSDRLLNKNVIVILSDEVSDSYLGYLRSLNISYLIAGTKDDLDLVMAMQKLKDLFGINKITLQGGGIINDSFLTLGLIDEISLIIAPIASGDNTATLFSDGKHLLNPVNSKEFVLKQCQPLENSGVYLNYQKH